jgi:thioredoxin 1
MTFVQNKICQMIFATVLLFGQKAFAQQVGTQEFADSLAKTRNATLLDVRTAGEYGGGHLVGAIHLDVKEANFEANLKLMDKTKPVFVYCLSGGRSATAHKILEKNGFAVVEMAGGYLRWSSENRPVEGTHPEVEGNAVMKLEEYTKMIADNKLVLVDYYATWCGPCKQMDPFVQKMMKDYDGKAKIVKIDTDKNKKLAIQNLVSELPTFIFYRNGKEFWRGTGLQDEEFLRELITLNLAKN